MNIRTSLAVACVALPVLGGCASGTATTTAATSSTAASSTQAQSTVSAIFNGASNMMSGVSLLTSAATGKGIVELALDTVTGLDCRFDSIIRENRKFCEERDSGGTEGDFNGLFGAIQDHYDSRERVLLSALTGVEDENKEYLMSGMDLRPIDAEEDDYSQMAVDKIDLSTDLLNYNTQVAVADFGLAQTYDFTKD